MPHPDKVVRITLNPRGLPIPAEDPIKIKKSSQKVKWCADFPFEIDIEGYSDVTRGAGDGDGAHNCKTGYFENAKPYKYSISANGQTNDPTLDVIP